MTRNRDPRNHTANQWFSRKLLTVWSLEIFEHSIFPFMFYYHFVDLENLYLCRKNDALAVDYVYEQMNSTLVVPAEIQCRNASLKVVCIYFGIV